MHHPFLLLSLLAFLFLHFSSALQVCERPWPEYPAVKNPNLHLSHVVVVMRHGDRAPHTQTRCWEGQKQKWNCTENKRLFTDSELITPGPGNDMYRHPHRLLIKSYLEDRNIHMGTCGMSELTSRGHAQHHRNGARMREIYVDRHGILEPTFNADSVYIRSTDVSRTLSSSDSFLKGLYPSDHNSTDTIIINTMDSQVDPMIPSKKNCPILGTLLTKARQSGTYINYMKKHHKFFAHIQRSMEKSDTDFDIDVAYDCLTCHHCHNMELPKGVTREDVALFQEVMVWRFNEHLLAPDRTMALKAWAGAFIEELMPFLTKPKQKKMMVFVGHDSTILPLSAALGFPMDLWIPYASALSIEVYRDHKEPVDYVRALLNDTPITMACGQLCRIEDFIVFISQFIREPGFCSQKYE